MYVHNYYVHVYAHVHVQVRNTHTQAYKKQAEWYHTVQVGIFLGEEENINSNEA